MAIIYFMIVFIIYFIPSLFISDKKHATGIFILNLLLGWTFIGWVVALVWAISDEKVAGEK